MNKVTQFVSRLNTIAIRNAMRVISQSNKGVECEFSEVTFKSLQAEGKIW